MDKEERREDKKSHNLDAVLTRRKALSKMATAAIGAGAVIVVGGVAYYLSSQAPPPAPTATTTAAATTSEVMTTAAPATSAPLPPEQDKIVYAHWPYRPDLEENNVEYFQSKYNESVTNNTIGGDYDAYVETQHILGAPLDICKGYANLSNRWYYAGWIRNLEDLPDVDKMKNEMYPAVYDNYRASKDGALLGLPYFISARDSLIANDLILEKAGLAGEYPTTYKELYQQCEVIKRKGAADYPWLPGWNAAYYGFWGFLFHANDYGDPMFDKTWDPVFDINTGAADVLRDWKNVWDKQLCPKGALTSSGDADKITYFATGKYAYSEEEIYDLRTFNDPSTSAFAGHATLVPVKDQPWGGLEAGMYMLTERKRTEDKLQRCKRFESFLGYKDLTGQLYVAKQWAINTGLNSGYAAILDDPDVIATYKSWLGERFEQEMGTIKKNMGSVTMPEVWRSPWYKEWEAGMNTEVANAITGKKSVEDAITTMRSSASDLKKKYPVQRGY